MPRKRFLPWEHQFAEAQDEEPDEADKHAMHDVFEHQARELSAHATPADSSLHFFDEDEPKPSRFSPSTSQFPGSPAYHHHHHHSPPPPKRRPSAFEYASAVMPSAQHRARLTEPKHPVQPVPPLQFGPAPSEEPALESYIRCIEDSLETRDFSFIPETAVSRAMLADASPRPASIIIVAMEQIIRQQSERIAFLEKQYVEDRAVLQDVRRALDHVPATTTTTSSLKPHKRRGCQFDDKVAATSKLSVEETSNAWNDCYFYPTIPDLRSFNFIVCVSKAYNLQKLTRNTDSGHFANQLREMASMCVKMLLPPGGRQVFISSSVQKAENGGDVIVLPPSDLSALAGLAMRFIICPHDYWETVCQQFRAFFASALNGTRRKDKCFAFCDDEFCAKETERVQAWYSRIRGDEYEPL